jgi:hypothetical protein
LRIYHQSLLPPQNSVERTWKEHNKVSSTLIIAPALSNYH